MLTIGFKKETDGLLFEGSVELLDETVSQIAKKYPIIGENAKK